LLLQVLAPLLGPDAGPTGAAAPTFDVAVSCLDRVAPLADAASASGSALLSAQNAPASLVDMGVVVYGDFAPPRQLILYNRLAAAQDLTVGAGQQWPVSDSVVSVAEMKRPALAWYGCRQVVANFAEPGDTSELFFSLSERHGEVREARRLAGDWRGCARGALTAGPPRHGGGRAASLCSSSSW